MPASSRGGPGQGVPAAGALPSATLAAYPPRSRLLATPLKRPFVCALLICRTGIAKEGAIDLMQASGGENSPAAGLPLTNELKRGH
jgi:hypothetical protein